ncbi:MAG: TonB-dependent receptor [Chromatiales bacterium]|nr:MAG: TonB-dependent receptor [Chromatiales bacterium]
MTFSTRVTAVTVGQCLLALTIAFGPVPAAAQFEEIIVSARKVEESLQDVPLSITALSSDTIERAGIVDLNDVAAFTPGLSFFNPIGDFLPTPIIRGVAQTDIFGETNVASFVDGVYVAGREGLNFNFLDVERIEVVKGPQSTLYGRNAFSGAINYVTRRAPEEFEVKVDATGGSDSRLAGRIQIGGPILGDQLRGLIAAGYDDFDGTYEDNLGGNDVGGREYKTYIGKLEWLPAENFEVVGTVYYSDDEIDISPTTSLPMNCQDIAVDPVDGTTQRLAAFCGRIPDLDSQNDRLSAAGYPNTSGDDTVNKIRADLGEDRDLTRASLNVNWDLDLGTFTWLTGYSKTEQQAVDDGARNLGNRQPFEFCPGGSFSCFNYVGVEVALAGLEQPAGKDETEEWSTELRFASPQDEALRGGGGFYYFDSEFKARAQGSLIATEPLPPSYDLNDSRFGPFVPLTPGGPPGVIAIGTPAFGPWFSPNGDLDSSSSRVDTDIESWASFAWLELDFLDERFTARAEIRYTYQEENTNTRSLNNAPPGCPGPGGLGCTDLDPTDPSDNVPDGVAYNYTDLSISGDEDWDFWTGRLTLEFRPSDEWLLYGTVANGTKSGTIETVSGNTLPSNGLVSCVGQDINGNPVVNDDSFCTAIPVDKEKITSYELGTKGTFAEGKVQFELIGFYNDWSDAAIRATFEEAPGTGVRLEQPEAVTQIAGEASVWGWESSLNFAPNENWLFNGGISYQDAQWDDAKLDSLRLFDAYGNADGSCEVDFSAGEVVPDYCGRIDGNQVARQPPWQARLSATYTRPVGLSVLNESWEVFGRADWTYEDDWYPQDDNLARIPSHTYTNVRLGLTSDRYSLEFWVKNLFEEQDASASFRDVFFGNTDNIYGDRPLGNGPNQFFPFRYTVSYPQLRTWGITARARFGGS